MNFVVSVCVCVWGGGGGGGGGGGRDLLCTSSLSRQGLNLLLLSRPCNYGACDACMGARCLHSGLRHIATG